MIADLRKDKGRAMRAWVMGAILTFEHIDGGRSEMKNHEPSLADRLGAAAKSRRTQLEQARANAPANDPGFAERQAARRAVGAAREARAAERKTAKLAEKARKAEERAAEEHARAITLIAEQEAREAEAAEQAAREIVLQAERKVARDAKYAARKARQR